MRRRRQRKDDKRTLEAHRASNRRTSTSPTLTLTSTLQSVHHLEFPVDCPRLDFPEHNSSPIQPVHQHDRRGEHTVAEELNLRTNEDTVNNILQPSSAVASVQLCPHDILPYERAQRLAKFMGCRMRSRPHPALLSDRNGDHSAGPYRSCKPVPGLPNLIRGEIHYHDFTPEFVNLKGLFVTSTWVINLHNLRELDNDKRGFQDLFAQSRIELCAHQKLVDPWAFGEICQIVVSSKDGAQASAQREGGEKPSPSNLTCKQCATKIKIYDRGFSIDVQAVRYLGEPKSEMDPLWLAQCRPTKE